MSYESQIYIVKPHREGLSMDFAEKIAIFRLGHVEGMYKFVRRYPESSCYILDDGGDAEIIFDKYGEPLREIPIRELIFELDRLYSKSKRWDIFAAMVALLHYSDTPCELVALHYGY